MAKLMLSDKVIMINTQIGHKYANELINMHIGLVPSQFVLNIYQRIPDKYDYI